MKGFITVLVAAAVVGIVVMSGSFAFGEDHAPGSVEEGVGALVDLLKEKGMLTQDDADRFHKEYRKEAPDQGLAALVEMLKNKKMLSEEEATRFTRTYVTGPAGQKVPTIASDRRDKEYMEKITANVTEEVKKGVQEQLRTDVRDEVARELEKRKAMEAEKGTGVHESEQIDELNHKLSDVTQKVAELYSGKAAQLAASAPEWAKRVRFGGDVRLRYEADRFDQNNAELAQPSNPSQLMNTRINEDRYKYRVRAGVAVDVNEQIEAVARLSTGNSSNPVSTNSIIGDFMNKDNVLFDLAYLKWKPSEFFTAYGGRIPNPWFSSDLLWARDLNFEGVALNTHFPLNESWTSFVTVGAFPLQQNDFTQHSKWLAAGQMGAETKNRSGITTKVAAAYYYFTNMNGIRNTPENPGANNWTAPLFQQKGNTLFNISADPSTVLTAYASEFKELNLIGTVDIGFWDPVHVVFLGDFVQNLGFDKPDVARRTGIPNPPQRTVGFQLGLTVGHPAIQEFGKWKVYLLYKYLGADAVVDAFTDSDFHLGGTNAKGWILGADVGLLKNTWATLRWMSSNEINGPKLAIDVLQLDLNVRF
ncbi:MAG TPA: putative porin [Thermodesulfovibrionales bacterium]|nr:putative porin [Thermodesulfovibrionales bacterium]